MDCPRARTIFHSCHVDVALESLRTCHRQPACGLLPPYGVAEAVSPAPLSRMHTIPLCNRYVKRKHTNAWSCRSRRRVPGSWRLLVGLPGAANRKCTVNLPKLQHEGVVLGK